MRVCVRSWLLFCCAGRSSSLENGDDTELDVELPSIPKMEIFSHPIAAAGGPKVASNKLGTSDDQRPGHGHSSVSLKKKCFYIFKTEKNMIKIAFFF